MDDHMFEYVTLSCGHVEKRPVGTPAIRQEMIVDYERRGLCINCLRKQIAKEAAEQNKADGMPALFGTDKQIAWAEQIRRWSIDRARARTVNPNEITDPKLKQQAIEYTVIQNSEIKRILQQRRASWWIDNKDKAYDMVIDRCNDYLDQLPTPDRHRLKNVLITEKKFDYIKKLL